MRDFIFRAYCFDKNGKLNYNRASKFLGYSKSDLYFMTHNNFEHLDSPTLMSGVLVGYHPTSTSPIYFAPWILKTCYHSDKDLAYIRHLIEGFPYEPKDSSYEYFIMNAAGKILYQNCNIERILDDSGIIHLKTDNAELNHFIFPADRKKYNYKKHFCYGSNLKSLTNHINILCDKKYIKVPKQIKKEISSTTKKTLNSQSIREK